MGKTGISPAPHVETGIDTEHLRLRLGYDAQKNKDDKSYQQRRLELLLSPFVLFFIIVLIVLVGAVIFTYVAASGSAAVMEFWKTIVLPIVTAFLGLAVGKKI